MTGDGCGGAGRKQEAGCRQREQLEPQRAALLKEPGKARNDYYRLELANMGRKVAGNPRPVVSVN